MKDIFRKEILKLSKSEDISFVKACQVLQGLCAKMKREDLILLLHELKMEYLNLN